MKLLGYILFTFVLLLTPIFIVFDFVLKNTPIILLLCILFYSINTYVILNIIKNNKTGNILVVILSLNYLVCCYSESFLLGVPLLFLFTFVFIKKIQLSIKILVSCVLVVLVFSLLIYKAISPSIKITEMNIVYNPDGNLSVISVSVDTGATGIDYKYQTQKELLNGLVCIRKTLLTSNNYFDVSWQNNNYCMINNRQYRVWFL